VCHFSFCGLQTDNLITIGMMFSYDLVNQLKHEFSSKGKMILMVTEN